MSEKQTYRSMEEKSEPRKKPTNMQTTNLQFSFFGLAKEALQIAVKRREAKSKGEKKRYTHLNAEFQTLARRDKKAFLRDQFKETEGNNRMGKTRDLFKKIRDTKGTLHAKMGTIKNRNGMEE